MPDPKPWGSRTPKLWYQRKPLLTLPEILAIRQAWESGEFTKASLTRIYGASYDMINRVVSGQYSHYREI